MLPNLKTIKKRKLSLSVGPTVISLIIVLFFFVLSVFSLAESNLHDLLFFTRSNQPHEDILIVEIDDFSQEKIGRFPWDRKEYAKLIDILNTEGKKPAVLAFDIAFFEKAEGDEELEESLRKASANNLKIVMAAQLKGGSGNTKQIQPIDVFDKYVLNGYVNLFSEEEGIIRKAPLRYYNSPDYYFGFANVITQEYSNEKDMDLKIENLPDNILINFTGPAGNISRVSFYDVLQGDIPGEIFKDKIVLVGATAPTLHDDRPVPGSSDFMPGVEIHANTIDTIISNRVFSEVEPILTIFFIAILALGIGFVTQKLEPLVSSIITVASIAMYVLIAVVLFSFNLLVPIFYPILVILLTWLVNYIAKYIQKSVEEKKVKEVFSNYVSKEVLGEILKNIDDLQLGGKKRNMTVLFSDIRGFTGVSEKVPAQKLLPVLNDFLTVQSVEIMKNQGIIDKFIGDAVMALFGAPLDDKDHAYHACLAAIAMAINTEHFKPFTSVANIPHFEIGIGINSGEMVVGNIGATTRFNYTAIGDNVNLASRLESLNKLYGSQILISENTAKAVRESSKFVDLAKDNYESGKINCVQIDRVMVKGKSNAVDIYNVFYKKLKSKDYLDIRTFNKGLQEYFRGNWKQASEILKPLSKNTANYALAKTSKVLIERMEETKNKSPRDWSGIWKLETK